MMIFDSSIVVTMEEDKGYSETKLTFNSFDNRDEVLDCITSIWTAQSPHAQQQTTELDDSENPSLQESVSEADPPEEQKANKGEEKNELPQTIEVATNNNDLPLDEELEKLKREINNEQTPKHANKI